MLPFLIRQGLIPPQEAVETLNGETTSMSPRPMESTLVGHGVENDIDSQGIGFFFGEFAKIPLVFPLPFPSIA